VTTCPPLYGVRDAKNGIRGVNYIVRMGLQSSFPANIVNGIATASAIAPMGLPSNNRMGLGCGIGMENCTARTGPQ